MNLIEVRLLVCCQNPRAKLAQNNTIRNMIFVVLICHTSEDVSIFLANMSSWARQSPVNLEHRGVPKRYIERSIHFPPLRGNTNKQVS